MPREASEFGHDTTWTTATRPTNPNHGTKGYNETTKQIEIYDAVAGYWLTSTTMLQVGFYP